MDKRPPGTFLLIAAVLTAILLMYGLGGSVVIVQMLVNRKKGQEPKRLTG